MVVFFPHMGKWKQGVIGAKCEERKVHHSDEYTALCVSISKSKGNTQRVGKDFMESAKDCRSEGLQ